MHHILLPVIAPSCRVFCRNFTPWTMKLYCWIIVELCSGFLKKKFWPIPIHSKYLKQWLWWSKIKSWNTIICDRIEPSSSFRVQINLLLGWKIFWSIFSPLILCYKVPLHRILLDVVLVRCRTLHHRITPQPDYTRLQTRCCPGDLVPASTSIYWGQGRFCSFHYEGTTPIKCIPESLNFWSVCPCP